MSDEPDKLDETRHELPRKIGKASVAQTVCPVCRGTGIDKGLRQRYTSGGHDDRRCERCNGDCYVDLEQPASE
jgi:hypothetical protein